MTSSTGRPARIQGLDLLRGVAVGLVMIRHAWPGPFAGAGIVGVTVFFTLSGYLITGLIARDLDSIGSVRWGRFYAHRALRLIPALLLLVAVFAVVEGVWAPLGRPDAVWSSVLIAVTYTADFPLPWDIIGISHLWSLAIEEQFYLVWPALLWLASRSQQRLIVVSASSAIILTAACWATLALASEPADIYRFPTTWASSMAIGAVAFFAQLRISRWLSGRRRLLLASVALSILAVLSIVPNAKDRTSTYLIWPTVIGLCTVALIWEARARPLVPLIVRPVVWLGLISYAVYLWNLPITAWLRAADISGALMVVSVPLTIAAAVVSWYTVERLGRAGRARFDSRQSASAARVRVWPANGQLDRSTHSQN